MRSPVQLCEDYDAPDLRALAKASRDANQTRRLLRWQRSMTGHPAARRPRWGHLPICSKSYVKRPRDDEWNVARDARRVTARCVLGSPARPAQVSPASAGR